MVAPSSPPLVLIFLPSFLLSYLLLSALHLPHDAAALTFDFVFSRPGGYNPANLSFMGDAYFNSQLIELTKNDRRGLGNSVGRALYAQPVLIWDEVTGETASFTTTFSIQILRDNIDNHSSGDGMAFFLGHYPSILPGFSGGENLGLFSPASSTHATGDDRVVAIEFDTFMNKDYDTSDNHMGIDINSLISKAYVNTSEPGRTLTSGIMMTCGVTYDNITQRLAAYLQVGDKRYRVETSANLSQELPSVVSIGFSAATGVAAELLEVMAWSFTSTIDRPPAAVLSPPEPSHALPPAAFNNNAHSPPAATSNKIPWKTVGPMITGAVVAVAACLLGLGGYVWRRRRNFEKYVIPTHVPRHFSYQELAKATNNFADERKLGEGGYSIVYRGELTKPISQSVAVKKFKPGTSAALGRTAFDDEIKVISHVRQRNLVELVGWCNDGNKHHLLLVYELVSEGSLDEHLHESRSWLSWHTRYNIILDLGRALRYLHEDSVLHGDIKPCNILLDSQHVAKLADFGLARFIDPGAELRTTRNVAGTPGYVDPDFITTGKRSRESDVYSFGIVLLEIVSGRRPTVVDHRQTMFTPLLIWIWGKHQSNAILEAADATLRDESSNADDQDDKYMERVLLVGLWCAHPDPCQRPPIEGAMRFLHSIDVEMPPLDPPVFLAGPLSFAADDRSSSEASDSATAVESAIYLT